MTYIGVISVKISCTDHNTINKWCSDATTVQKTGPHVEKRTETIGSHRNTTFLGTQGYNFVAHFLRQTSDRMLSLDSRGRETSRQLRSFNLLPTSCPTKIQISGVLTAKDVLTDLLKLTAMLFTASLRNSVI